MENTENRTGNTLLRILVIAGILVILIFLSIGIVKVVPKILNSLANTSLSIGDMFSGKKDEPKADNIATTTPPQYLGNTATSSSFSISDLTSPAANTVTTPATTTPANSLAVPGYTNTNTNTSYSNQTYSRTTSTKTVGPSDILVEIKSVGIISKTTGQFITSNSFSTGDMVVVKFKIENRGSYATGKWSARVEMPSYDAADKVRTLGPINSLPTGTAVVGEARFNNPIPGNQAVTIHVDTGGTTQDTNRSNNTATINLSIVTITQNTNPVYTNPTYTYPTYTSQTYTYPYINQSTYNGLCYYQNGSYYGNCANVVNTNYDYNNYSNCYYANGIYYGNCSNYSNNNNSYYNQNNSGNMLCYNNGIYYYTSYNYCQNGGYVVNNNNSNNYPYNTYNNGDLDVRIVSTGIINTNGVYTPTTSPRRGDKLAVQFEIRNIGNQNSPAFSWRTDATGAISNNYTSSESVLAPGVSIIRIASFDTNFTSSTGNVYFTVMVDSGNTISEASESNNTASANLYLNY